MVFRFSHAPVAALTFAMAALAVGAAMAQGTDEQREACAPDAVRLCQDTIPDIPRTTACMKAHFAELSPRCKVAFNAVTSTPGRKNRRTAMASPAPDARMSGAAAPGTAQAQPAEQGLLAPGLGGFGTLPGLQSYAEQIRGYCRQGLIDPYTCHNTLAALQGMQ